jgi:hypothetical protein
MKNTVTFNVIFIAIFCLSAFFFSCTEEEVENHSLVAFWTTNDFPESDNLYNLWIKNDSLFTFYVMYRVYDGVAWDSISGMKTYTGKYYTEGNKLVFLSDSMFVKKNLNDQKMDTVARNQLLFKDCVYRITGKKLQIDYTLYWDVPPYMKRTMYFYIFEY